MSFYFKIRTVEKEIICPLQPLKKKTKTKIKQTYHIVIITSRKSKKKKTKNCWP